MPSWEKVIPIEEIKADTLYFLANAWTTGHGRTCFNYWSQYLSGKQGWTVKPGIAILLDGAQILRVIERDKPRIPGLCALAIPKDADRRWKARGKPRRGGLFERKFGKI